ncbi:MAG: RsmE family RNA methyltransferase [Halobacteriovoraceae bacterium]|nr:RsmE family RNA methyltransferase [Halobacteriovoraceae bacterium]
MNRIFLKQSTDKDQIFVVNQPSKVEHLLSHLKVKRGSSVKVAVQGMGLGDAEVIECTRSSVSLKTNQFVTAAHQPYTLIVASSRPPTMKKVLEHGSSLGVGNFIFFSGELSEKSYLKSKIYEKNSLEDLLTLGIEQAGCFSKLPQIQVVETIEQAMERAKGPKYLLSLEGENLFEAGALKSCEEITLAIGPERGWTSNEEKKLLSNKFTRIKISKSILRVEIATFVALGQLEYLFKKGS